MLASGTEIADGTLVAGEVVGRTEDKMTERDLRKLLS
jgi:hypothetical protein